MLTRMTGTLAWLAAAAAALAFAAPAHALDPRYPDWPCQQLKVPGIALSSVWSGPTIEGLDKSAADQKLTDLAARLAARRTPIEDARRLIAEFLTGTPAERLEKGRALFAQIYASLNAQRDEVMAGIERFSRKEKGAADEIRALTRKLQQLQDAAGADAAEIDALASDVAWRTRIFEERRKSTTYVCEVPVIIEKRVRDLAQAIQQGIEAEAQAQQ